MKNADLIIEIDPEGDTNVYLIPGDVVGDNFESEQWMEYIGEDSEENISFSTCLEAIRYAEEHRIKINEEFHFNTY